MAIKVAIYNDYVITQEESKSINIIRFCNKGEVKENLRRIAHKLGFEYDPNWTTRQLGNKLLSTYGEVLENEIQVLDNGSIHSYETFEKTKPELRKIAAEIGFTYDENWNTQTLGSKLIDFINQNND